MGKHGTNYDDMHIPADDNPHTREYAKVTDVPTDVLASRFVGSLILAKGNLSKYQGLTAQLIRELRGEADPSSSPQQKIVEK